MNIYDNDVVLNNFSPSKIIGKQIILHFVILFSYVIIKFLACTGLLCATIHWQIRRKYIDKIKKSSTKLATMHPWVKGIQVCTNEGPRPFPRRINTKLQKIYGRFLKIFFSITTGQVSTNLSTNHLWVKGI